MLTPPVSERDHTQGPATAAITLVEYGDYHTHQCAVALPWIEALQSQMGDRLRLVFRHFPASGLHPHAAEAAEAAGLQERFWDMHEVLLEHQSALGNGHLVEYARDLGLDPSRFLRDMAGDICAERVRSDLVSGGQSGVQNTPTFFVNGVRQIHSWEESLISMAAILSQNLGEAGRLTDDSTDLAPGGDEKSREGSHAP